MPFDSAYKFMATFHEMTDDAGRPVIRLYAKGAPDQLLARAAFADDGSGTQVAIDQVRDAAQGETSGSAARACG